MKRMAMADLLKWKDKINHKPLIIEGGMAGRENLAHERVWDQFLF